MNTPAPVLPAEKLQQARQLLQRQLQRLQLSTTDAPDGATWPRLVERVSRAYHDFDQERYLLERSQDLASHELMALNDALRTSQARLTSLVSLSSDWIWEQDAELRFTYISEPSAGSSRLDLSLLVGVSLTDAERIDTATEDAAQYRRATAACEPFRELTFGLRQPGGKDFHLRLSGEPVFGPARELLGYRGVGADVTRAVSVERQLRHMARFDALTGLANRTQFTERLELAQATSRNQPALGGGRASVASRRGLLSAPGGHGRREGGHSLRRLTRCNAKNWLRR